MGQTPASNGPWAGALRRGLCPALRAGPPAGVYACQNPLDCQRTTGISRLASFGRWVRNTPEAWEIAITDTIAHLANYQKKAAREPFLFALGQDVSANIEKVLKIYTAIINQ